MSDEAELRWEKLASRYELPGQAEWQKLLHHFKLSEGFSLVVLLVLDMDGAALCRRDLEKHMEADGKRLFAIEFPTPDDLRRLSTNLLATQPPPNSGCVWMAAVQPDYDKAYPEWRDAWQLALARLNSHRNIMRRQFSLPLVFVGAPWLQEIMREIAPDLWSVRTLVVRIEPLSQTDAGKLAFEPSKFDLENEKSGADPIFALKEAEKLRGVPGKELALAGLLFRAGEGFASRHDWPAAQKAYVEALELNGRAGAAPDRWIDNLNELAVACAITGHYREAISYLEKSLMIARENGDKRREGNALANLGVAYADLGQPRKAIEFQEQALLIARDIGNRRGEGRALGNLGIAYADLGQPRKDVEFYERALHIARDIGDKGGEGSALGNLGNAYMNLGDLHKAIEYCKQALLIIRELGDRRNEGNALGNLGFAYANLGETRKAVEYYEQALLIAREIGDRRGEDMSLGNLADAYLNLGELRKAVEFYGKALGIAREIGDRFVEGTALYGFALASDKLNDGQQATACAEAALKILKEIESPLAAQVEAQLAAWRGQVK